jgi:carbon-monoxide dehydrogenase medium subunit
MKPQSFEYLPTRELDAALEALGQADDEVKVLAGGQSLVPVMNLRLAQPTRLVDINGIDALAQVDWGTEHVRLGALVRHRQLERGIRPGDRLSDLLSEVAGHIGHLPVRVRGTLGGSLAHADPGAEWCLVALALEASVEIAARSDRRLLGIDALLEGPFTTALRSDEIITALVVPRTAQWSYGFAEHAQTHGAFAQSGACVALQRSGDTVGSARVAVMGVAGRAQRLGEVEAGLIDCPVPEAPERAQSLCAASVDPRGYDEVSPDYLRALTASLVRRATSAALARAEEAA